MNEHLKKWIIFIWERFPPYVYIPFLMLFFVAHYVFATNNNYSFIYSTKSSILLVATVLFFFMLRLYDEVKDFESDLKNHPTRPLPRGLVTRSQINIGIVTCIVLELFLFSFFGLRGLAIITLPILYSLLMFKEFFIKKWIRSHVTFYAITHTFVSSLFSLTLLSLLMTTSMWSLNSSVYLFALLSWCLFNIFEFGRKTFISKEEKKNIESYSKIYGRLGASLLTLVMAVCSLWILYYLHSPQFTFSLILLTIILFSIVSFLFIVFDKEPFGKIYRAMSSIFIALFYLIFIVTK